MTNNNFMKAMSMIDEDLLHEADTAYTEETADDRFEEIFTENEEHGVASGVDVYHGSLWKKFLAVAATFVIVAGAIGGGTYYFSKIRNNNNIIDEDIQYDTIYDKLRANKDKYKMELSVHKFDTGINAYEYPAADKEKFFEYMDSLEVDNDVEYKDITKLPINLRFVFSLKSDIYKCIYMDLYRNGDCSWTEIDDRDIENKRITYHSFVDGKKVYNDLLAMFSRNNTKDIINGFKEVYPEEIEAFIDESYSRSFEPTSSLNNTAVMHEGSKTDIYEFSDRKEINNLILDLEWERAEEFDNINSRYYSINGMSLSEDGYLAGYYNGYYVVYKLKDDLSLDTLGKIWNNLLIPIETIDIGSNTLDSELQQISNETIVQWQEGPMYVGQGGMDYDNINYYYHFSDAKSFTDGIMSLEWERCGSSGWDSEVENMSDDRGYVSEGYYTLMNNGKFEVLSLSPHGYIKMNDLSCYKLKYEEDAGKLKELFDKYLIMDDSSVLARKISKGTTDFNNLKAHFTFEESYDGEEYQKCNGYLSVDAQNERMFMTGEGTFSCGELKDVTSVVLMNGHDDSAYRITDKETNEDIIFGLYHYENGMAISPPKYHYIYICKDIEKLLSPRYTYSDNEYSIEEREADGNTEITIQNKSTDKENIYSVTIVLNKKGQLISYDSKGVNHNVSFKLDDYVFDSSDFYMEDVGTIYEKIKEDQEQMINKSS